jgi:hypothetical protein
MKKQNNFLRVQTNAIPGEITSIEANEIARGISLYHKSGKYMCQTFFTPPRIGEINWIEGIEKGADACFRSIRLIGNNLFHVRCMGAEKKVREVCEDPMFFQMLRGISTTLNETVQSRVYLDATDGRETCDCIVSLDKRGYYLANNVDLDDKKIRIKNIVIVGDRLLGLTEEGKAVISQLTPEVFEKKDYRLEVSFMDELNKIGRIDMLTPVPNSEISFLACSQNNVYEVDIHGNMIRFQAFDDRVKQINHIDFNKVRSLFATNEGLYEVEVEELPQMVRSISLPRLISHPELKGSFALGHYVEDPYILGVHPALGILAKTENDRVVCF